MINPLNLCRVCGFHFEDGYLPWGENGHTPMFDFCPCCGVEFGYQDCQESAAIKYRTQWVEKGCAWSEPQQKPSQWSCEEQQENLALLEGLPQLGAKRDNWPITMEEMKVRVASHRPKWEKP